MAELAFVTVFNLHMHIKKVTKRQKFEKINNLLTSKQNANLKLYLCLPEGATCVCIIIS